MSQGIYILERGSLGFEAGMNIFFNNDGTISVVSYDNGPGGGASPQMDIVEYYMNSSASYQKLLTKDVIEAVTKLIDHLVGINKVSYSEIYRHIVDGSARSRGYIEIAQHCASKLGFKNIQVWDDLGISEEKRQSLLTKPLIDYKKIKEKAADDEYLKWLQDGFYERLKKQGFTKYETPVFRFSGGWYDQYGEKISITPPKIAHYKDNGSFKYEELPIIDERAIANYYEKCKVEHCAIKDEIIESYEERCDNLAEQLLMLGVKRDPTRHAFFDAKGKKVIVRIPDIYDENDLGEWHYDVPNQEGHCQDKDNTGYER